MTATVILLLFDLAHSGVCPPCYRDQAILRGHGPVFPPSDTRRMLIITNDVPGNNQSKVTSAINGGALKWNDARDTTSNAPNSYTTPYFFTAGGFAQADFRVVSTGTSGPPASIDLDHYPHEIRIRSDVLNSLSAVDLAAMIAHELGHRIGLANWDQEASCPNVGSTIMNGSNPLDGFRMHTTEVKPNDVFQVNRSFDESTTQNCQVDAPTTAGTPPCTDYDGDGICAQDDCSDTAWDPLNQCSGACPSQQEYECALLGYPYTWDASACRCDWHSGECAGGYNCTPVIVDVLGNGVKLTSLRTGVTFDLSADGQRGWLPWTAPSSDDAWLALDANGNVRIDDGTELFGNFTPQPEALAGSELNGFLALAEYDKQPRGGNGDGKIDGSDAVFSSLLLWQDVNHNGTSELTELHSLAELGLTSMDLGYERSRRVDKFGNEFRYRSKVTDRYKTQLGRWAWDVFLSTSP
jgi:hypothetical protein